MKKSIVSLALVAVLLSGCATDPYTGESKVSKTAWGTGAGAALGAGVGALAGGGRGALIGAGVGALGGAAVGGYMDIQARELREELTGTGVQIQNLPDGRIVLIMPSNVTFATNSAVFQTSFNKTLDSVAKVLAKYDKTNLSIVGHTDSTGTLAHNNQLSFQRAQAVADYLANRNINRSRMHVSGVGPAFPIASNDTEEGRAQNRRVEITLQQF